METAPKSEASTGDAVNRPSPEALAATAQKSAPEHLVTRLERGTAQWGLASLLLALTLLVLFPVCVITLLTMQISIQDGRYWGGPGLATATVLAIIGSILYVVATLFGLVFSLGGLLRSLRRKHPRATHAAAAVVSALAVMGAVLVAATAISILVGVWEF